jgi:hypothetical protein
MKVLLSGMKVGMTGGYNPYMTASPAASKSVALGGAVGCLTKEPMWTLLLLHPLTN